MIYQGNQRSKKLHLRAPESQRLWKAPEPQTFYDFYIS